MKKGETSDRREGEEEQSNESPTPQGQNTHNFAATIPSIKDITNNLHKKMAESLVRKLFLQNFVLFSCQAMPLVTCEKWLITY